MSFPQASYLPLQHGRRFGVRHVPAGRGAGALVFVHPFAEEMNRSRRMAAVQARALAQAGWHVLQLDLFGCGDSEGDFGDADWAHWIRDVRAAAAWLEAQTGHAPALWGLRVGCLLACAAAQQMDTSPPLLLWQPVISGRQALQQFLRLRVAGQLFADKNAPRTDTKQLREQLLRGDSLDIAGYRLSSGLARGLDAATLSPPPRSTRVAWFEIGPTPPQEPTPAARGVIDRWRAAGHALEWMPAAAPAFWQTLEIAESVDLATATCDAIASWRT